MSDGKDDPGASFTDHEDDGSADRRQIRYDVDLTVTVNSDSNFLAGAATNLSAGGVFISTTIVHPIGTKFNVSIHMDDGKPGMVHAMGEVRWHRIKNEGGESQGLGIKFLQIASEDEDRIREFLARRKPMLMGDADEGDPEG